MRLPLFTASAAVIGLSGCASIVSGHNQPISVEARAGSGEPVVGAICRLSNNKGEWFVTTPGSTTVRRSYENLGVRCDKEPLEPGLASVASKTKPMAFGNLLFGGVPGVAIDIGTGAAYDYPPLLTVFMGQVGDGIGPEVKAAMETAKANTPAERAERNVAARRTAAELPATQPAAVAVATPPPAAIAVVAPPPPPIPAPVPVPPPTPPAPPAVASVSPVVPAAQVAPALPIGYPYKFLYQAERVPEVRACPFGPNVKLAAVSPGVEVYSAHCGQADVVMLRCEWGTCRVLR